LVGSPKAKDKEDSPVVKVLPPWGVWEENKKDSPQNHVVRNLEEEEEEEWSLDSQDKLMSEYQKQFQWHEESSSVKTARKKMAEKNSARVVTYTLSGGEKPQIPMSPKQKKVKKEAQRNQAVKLLEKVKTSDSIYSLLHPPAEVEKTFDTTLLHKSDNIWPLIEDSQLQLKKKDHKIQKTQISKGALGNVERKEQTEGKTANDPAIDDNTVKYVNPNHIDQVGALLQMLSVNNNLPPKKNEVQKMSTKKETNTKHNTSTKEISKKSHEKVQEKVKLNTRSKKEKKAPSIKTKSTQAKQKK